MNVLLLSRYGDLGASSRLRSYQYLPYLRGHGIDVTRAPLFQDSYLRELYAGRKPALASVLTAYLKRLAWLNKRRSFDLLWIEYEVFPWLPGWLESLVISGSPNCVVDYDDAIFHRYDQHPNSFIRRLLGRKIDDVMRLASIVIVGNDYLGDRATKAGAQRVEILPTSIDLSRYPTPKLVRNEKFVIGWIGSPATTKYLHRVRPALAEICLKERARVILVGAGDPGWNNVPYEVHPWLEDTEVAEVSAFDVGIMPLEDSPWERGKCGYKLIQYMACGKPVVASPVGINTRIVESGTNGYLAASRSDWVQALTALIRDSGLGWKMGVAGREKVEGEYSIQANAPRLAALLYEAAGKKRCVV